MASSDLDQWYNMHGLVSASVKKDILLLRELNCSLVLIDLLLL